MSIFAGYPQESAQLYLLNIAATDTSALRLASFVDVRAIVLNTEARLIVRARATGPRHVVVREDYGEQLTARWEHTLQAPPSSADGFLFRVCHSIGLLLRCSVPRRPTTDKISSDPISLGPTGAAAVSSSAPPASHNASGPDERPLPCSHAPLAPPAPPRACVTPSPRCWLPPRWSGRHRRHWRLLPMPSLPPSPCPPADPRWVPR